MSVLQRVRDLGRTRKFRPDDLPEAESPPPRLDLQGHPSDQRVRRVAVLPEGARVATACDDGHVRVFDVRGDGRPLVDIPAHAEWVTGLSVLDDHVLASASGWKDSKLHTWDARTGERVDTIDVEGGGVGALAAVGPETLVAGLESGAVVFIQHTRGRQLAEVARDERAHSDWIQDIAWHEDVMVTAGDKTARVWSLSTRKPLAVLRGHRDCGVGLQGAATPLVVDRFVRHTAQVIAAWETVPVEARQSIRAAAEGLGMTWEEFCEMILKANDVVQGTGTGGCKVGADGVDTVAVEEVEGGEEDGSDEACVLDGLDMGRTEADGEEGNAGEAGDDRRSGGEDRGREMHSATVDDRDTSSGETREAKLVDSYSEVGNTVLPTDREPNMQELEALAFNSDHIRRLNEKQASTLLAAAMVKFVDERSDHCVVIGRAIYRAFHRSYVDGEALLDTFGADHVLKLAKDELNLNKEYLVIDESARSVLEDRLSSYLAKIPRRRQA